VLRFQPLSPSDHLTLPPKAPPDCCRPWPVPPAIQPGSPISPELYCQSKSHTLVPAASKRNPTQANSGRSITQIHSDPTLLAFYQPLSGCATPVSSLRALVQLPGARRLQGADFSAICRQQPSQTRTTCLGSEHCAARHTSHATAHRTASAPSMGSCWHVQQPCCAHSANSL